MLVNVRKFLINKFAKSRAVVVYTAALFFQKYFDFFVIRLINLFSQGFRPRVLIFPKCSVINIMFVDIVNFYFNY